MSLASVAAASGEECATTALAYEAKPIFHAILEARDRFGGDRVIFVDGDGRELTYDAIIRASFALGHALSRGSRSGDAVGLMLPTGAGALLGFMALSAYGRVPALLNFTSGAAGVKSALRTAEVKRIITARKLVEIAKLEDLVTELESEAEIIYLEDARDNLTFRDKAMAVMGSLLPHMVAARPAHNMPAVILFTSGTEGQPKGVALSHSNLVSNMEQVNQHIELFPDTDVLFNPLPIFHCFGLTVGTLLPLYVGVKTVSHPTPLQPREIARRIKQSKATILLSTDTFISQYARAGEAGDLNSLRLAVCGAERLRDETRALLRKKYSIELLEGYGVSEASPVVAANQIGANHPGTVGRFMQGIEYKLEPVEGIPNAGRLIIRGPNIMLGYMSPDQPGVITPPENGWYDTGDVVSIDEDGFIQIRGRLKRFAKIGGEAVSLAVVESCASAMWPDHSHAALTLPDKVKGEQIILITDCPSADRMDLVGWTHNHGVSDLAIPRRIVQVEAIPVLGTGKTDYVRLERMMAEQNAALQN